MRHSVDHRKQHFNRSNESRISNEIRYETMDDWLTVNNLELRRREWEEGIM